MSLTNVLRDLRTHIASGIAHAATSAKTANTIMARDANGRTKVADPAAADDAVTKGYADTLTATETQARINADTVLQGSIAAEVAARQSAEAGLSSRITGLEASAPSAVNSGKGHWVTRRNVELVVQGRSLVFAATPGAVYVRIRQRFVSDWRGTPIITEIKEFTQYEQPGDYWPSGYSSGAPDYANFRTLSFVEEFIIEDYNSLFVASYVDYTNTRPEEEKKYDDG